MTTKINTPLFYSTMNNNNNNNDEQLFSDEQIQRYDADTIKHRFGDNWRNYASNVREVKQADGSIVRGKYSSLFICRLFLLDLEYIIEDPSLLQEIKPSVDSASSSTGSDDEQQLSKNKFAQIKAKFEQKSFTNVMASPSSSSVASSHTATRRNSNRQLDDFNARNRRNSNDSLSNNRINSDIPHAPPISSNLTQSSSNSQKSGSISNTSFRRINSADEADEEVQRIHRQGTELRHHQPTSTPISSINETNPQKQQQSNIQYEVVDEDGNPMAIDGIHDLIKMSGVTAREVPQPDGTLVREYVIDDPNILSKFQSRVPQDHIPPPPPRIPLKQSMLFRQEPLHNEPPPPINLQQIRTLEPQRRYEFITTSGKRIEFMITSLGSDESDIHELANEINTRLLPSNPSQQPFTLPKPWHPAVDLTHRELQNRQQTGSDNQPIPTDLTRSASYGGLNQGTYPQQFAPVFAEPIIDWSAVRQQDPHGQIDPQLIQQFITQKHQNGSFQTSAQFLPEQQQQQPPMIHATNSPSRNSQPMFYQQTMTYPYQGQQQHGVRILPNNTNDFNFHQQQIANGHTRI
jgi:hypothetical protein